MDTVGERIRYCRKQKGLTIQQVSDSIGSNKGTISKYENNSNEPSPKTIVLLCELFDVSIDWMLTGKERVLYDVVADSQQKKKLLEYFEKLSPNSKTEVLNFIKFRLQSEQSDDFMASSAYQNGSGSTGGSSGENLA